MSVEVDPERVESDLAELSGLAAERVAWSEEWRRAREWLFVRGRAAGLAYEVDRAGNQWFTTTGGGTPALIIGGHLDTTPGWAWGGGALSLLAGLEIARLVAAAPSECVSLRVVNWADGEGMRFGRPFGASAAAGRLDDWYAAEELVDATGASLREAAHACGIQPKLAQSARRLLTGTSAYIEIGSDLAWGPTGQPPLTVVASTMGVERCRLRWIGRGLTGRGAHEEQLGRLSERFTRELDHTFVDTAPSFRPERLPHHRGDDHLQLDLWLQHADLRVLDAMLEVALDLSDRIAAEGGASVEWRRLWRAPPVNFDTGLTGLLSSVLHSDDPPRISSVTTLQGGASELARSGLPAALLLAESQPGGWSSTTIAAALNVLAAIVDRACVREG